jgi:nucleotide-binding universal stress UspA family protein
MRRFKNILLVLTDNDDEKILHRATNIIRTNKGRLTLVRVLSKVPDKILSRLNSSYRIDINELAAVEFQKSMNQLLDPLREEGLNVHGRFLFGSPFLEIIRQVLRQDHDLVMTTAEEKGFPRTALFGSTTMHLLRECPCPCGFKNPLPVIPIPGSWLRLIRIQRMPPVTVSMERSWICHCPLPMTNKASST